MTVSNRMPVMERFEAQTRKGPDCWIWVGAVLNDGYGQIGMNGRLVRVHRFAYEVFRGPIPADRVIDHLCHNRLCVNPDHLEIVTIGENVRRGWSKNRTLRTHCVKGHTLLDSWPMRNGWRSCQMCSPQLEEAS